MQQNINETALDPFQAVLYKPRTVAVANLTRLKVIYMMADCLLFAACVVSLLPGTATVTTTASQASECVALKCNPCPDQYPGTICAVHSSQGQHDLTIAAF
jgi:hypothetical protein